MNGATTWALFCEDAVFVDARDGGTAAGPCARLCRGPCEIKFRGAPAVDAACAPQPKSRLYFHTG